MSPQFNYTVAPHLEEFAVPFPTFRAANPRYGHFVGGGLIFSRTAVPEGQGTKIGTEGEKQPKPFRLLLLQRDLKDSYGGHWEGPGGSCDPEDETLLDGVAREIFEEAGLRVSRFVELVGKDEWVHPRRSGGEIVVKYTFLVEVHEATPAASGDGHKGSGLPANKLDNGTVVSGSERGWEYRIKLDPAEHQAFEWVTEEEVRQGEEDNSGKFKSFATQGKTMLNGFKILRERPLLA